MRKIFNKKGFTLIEVIVAFGIVTVMIAAIYMLFGSSFRLIEVNRKDALADTVLEKISDYIKNTTGKNSSDMLIYEGDSVVFSNVAKAGYVPYAIGIIDGRLYDFGEMTADLSLASASSDKRCFNEAFYNGIKVAIGVKRFAGNGKWVEITLTALRDDEKVTRNRVINYTLLSERSKIFMTPDNIDIDIENPKDIFIVYYKLLELP